jgi:hypothetical protein
MLGGSCEGIVIKPVEFLAVPETAKRMAVKLVREEYKESQVKSWKRDNPSQSDILTQIGEQYAVEARFRKAIQHLDEAGTLERDVRDIGPLMKELGNIERQLWNWAKKNITRKASAGLPAFYKAWLVDELQK